MKYLNLSFACSAFALAVAAPASAQVVYQSVADMSLGAVDGNYALCSNCSYADDEVFDKFTLGSATTITGMNLWIYASGGYENVVNSGITFSVWDSTHTNLIASQLIMPTNVYDTRQGSLSQQWLVGGSIADLSLAAGDYYASFYADNLGVMTFGGGNGSLLQKDHGNGTYASVGDNAGYLLLGHGTDNVRAVPEPASWAMMVGGFGLIGGAMRRRRTAVTFA